MNYNNLSRAAVAELTELAQRRGMEAAAGAQRARAAAAAADSGQPGASQRINFGLYLFAEDERWTTRGA